MAGPTDIKILGTDGQWHSLKGPKGDKGPAGSALHMLGSVKNKADADQLLKTTGQNPGDAHIQEDNGHLWVWDGTAWKDVGQIKGDPGIQGKEGKQGPAGRYTHTFDDPAPGPTVASDLKDPTKEPNNANPGDIWFVP